MIRVITGAFLLISTAQSSMWLEPNPKNATQFDVRTSEEGHEYDVCYIEVLGREPIPDGQVVFIRYLAYYDYPENAEEFILSGTSFALKDDLSEKAPTKVELDIDLTYYEAFEKVFKLTFTGEFKGELRLLLSGEHQPTVFPLGAAELAYCRIATLTDTGDANLYAMPEYGSKPIRTLESDTVVYVLGIIRLDYDPTKGDDTPLGSEIIYYNEVMADGIRGWLNSSSLMPTLPARYEAITLPVQN